MRTILFSLRWCFALLSWVMLLNASYGSEVWDPESKFETTQQTYFPLDTRMLNEGKGHTLWIAPSKVEQVVWAKYGDLSQKIQALLIIPSEFEITTAPRTSYQDARMLHHMMGAYEASFVQPETMNEWIGLNCHNQEVFVKKGDALIVKSENLLDVYLAHQRSLEHYQAFIKYMMACGEGLNVQQVFAETMWGETTDLNNDCAFQALCLKALGFNAKAQPKMMHGNSRFLVHHRALPGAPILQKLPTIWYLLKLKMRGDNPVPLRHSAINDSHITMNVILRNGQGNCVGGICGLRSQKGGIDLLELSIYSVQDSLRGRGFGRKLMESLLQVNKKGHPRIWAYAASFYHTAFLEKMGFKKRVTYPRCLPDRNGQRSYDYLKYFYEGTDD